MLQPMHQMTLYCLDRLAAEIDRGDLSPVPQLVRGSLVDTAAD